MPVVNGEDRAERPARSDARNRGMRRTCSTTASSSQLVDDVPREDVDDLIDYLANEIESMDLFFTSGSTTGDKLEHCKDMGVIRDIRSASKTAPVAHPQQD
ncbi:hypothetical protein GS426_19960 [Rhodococcus hoagii]|nr:hypothetical protein [Prescottella equi]